MDKSNVIQEHGKEKLEIYKQYLKSYLSVLIKSKWWPQINIYDVFAGAGKDKNGTSGSALIAAEIINGYLLSKSNNGTYLKLFVNELDKERFNSLKNELNQYNFVEYSNIDADKFIGNQANIKPNQKSQNLFFIDPFGYTQYSFKNLFKVASSVKKSEFLIFIHISNIFRFANSDAKQAKPTKDFLSSIGINESIDSNNDLINKIVNALKQQFKTEFVYSYKLENTEARNSVFGLFFISQHILGAQKYLEAMSKVESLNSQLELFKPSDSCLEFKKFITTSKSNHEIHHWSIVNGLLPRETNAMLKGFQKDGHLEILPPDTRKSSFYIAYQHSKKIVIKYTDE